jgi:protein PhnA
MDMKALDSYGSCRRKSGPSSSRRDPNEKSWSTAMDDVKVKDSNGTILSNGDSVTLIKDLKVKGSSVTLKRGTLIKNIRLTSNEGEIECNADKVKGLVLKTCFLKKA